MHRAARNDMLGVIKTKSLGGDRLGLHDGDSRNRPETKTDSGQN